MIKSPRRRVIAAGLLIGTSLSFAAPAVAQVAAPASPEQLQQQSDESAPDIVVTGSLISNPNLETSSPVTVIGSDEILLRQVDPVRWDAELTHAWALLSGPGPAVRVAAVADEIGWSRRHLGSRFSELDRYVGPVGIVLTVLALGYYVYRVATWSPRAE